MDIRTDARITALAGPHGLVTRAQLLAAGITHDAIDRRVRRRLLNVVHRNVYAVGRRELDRVAAAERGYRTRLEQLRAGIK